jgi:integrase
VFPTVNVLMVALSFCVPTSNMRPRKKNRHLPPCVYLSHGAYYLVRKNVWEPLGRDLSGALAEYARRVAETPKGSMGELIERVLAHIAPKKSTITNKQYRTIGNKLKEILAEFSPEQVQPKHVAAIKVRYAETPFYANRLVSVLRMVFGFAVEWQIVGSNPCVGVSRHAEAKRGRYLTDAEYRSIYDHAGPRLRIIIDLLYLTGQRISDVLRISHRDITDKGIEFNQQKTGAKLIVRWTPDLRAVVERAKALNGNVRALTLLHNRKGKAPDYSTIKGQWDEARKAAGIPDARIHDLRAKSLTDAKREGKDAQALAGHTTAKQTETYIRLRETPVVDGPSIRHLIGSG